MSTEVTNEQSFIYAADGTAFPDSRQGRTQLEAYRKKRIVDALSAAKRSPKFDLEKNSDNITTQGGSGFDSHKKA